MIQQIQTQEPMRITAVIPAYNAERYIARAIESVLSQTRPVDEIIVVDDGSRDKTAEVVRAFGDGVRFIQQPNAGASAARNAGIMAAAGNWIAFLDADDEWLPDRIRLQVDLLGRCQELVWVCGNYLRCLCGEQKQKPDQSEAFIQKALNGKEYFDNYFDAFLQSIHGSTDTKLIKKSVLLEAGLFRVGQQQMEDMDLWWKIAARHPAIGYIAAPLAIYHLGVENSLIQRGADYAVCRRMIQRHLQDSQSLPIAASVRACSVQVLKGWIRSMLFCRQDGEIKKTLTEFDGLFSRRYRCGIRLLAAFPKLTAWALCLASRLVRAMSVRRQLTRKPRRLQ